MPVKEEYHNVSVRLKDSDYKKLLFLHNKFSSMSYGKVTYADVLRISLTETFLRESEEPNKPVSNISRKEEQKETAISVEEIEQAISDNPSILSKLAEIISLDSSNTNTPKDSKEQFLSELEAVQSDTKEEEVETGEIKPTVNSFDEIEKELEELEKGLRSATNSKNKPYSEKYIQDQLSKRRKELEK
jgi:hypothetical protein